MTDKYVLEVDGVEYELKPLDESLLMTPEQRARFDTDWWCASCQHLTRGKVDRCERCGRPA